MSDVLVFPLRNDLQLTITGQPTLHALGNFLKAAIVHLKNQRDIQKVALYKAGSFQGRVGSGDCAVSHPGDAAGDYLSPAAWVEAVTDAYFRLNALEQMLKTPPQPAAAAETATTAQVKAAVQRGSPGDHLTALGLMLQEPPHRTGDR